MKQCLLPQLWVQPNHAEDSQSFWCTSTGGEANSGKQGWICVRVVWTFVLGFQHWTWSLFQRWRWRLCSGRRAGYWCPSLGQVQFTVAVVDEAKLFFCMGSITITEVMYFPQSFLLRAVGLGRVHRLYKNHGKFWNPEQRIKSGLIIKMIVAKK